MIKKNKNEPSLSAPDKKPFKKADVNFSNIKFETPSLQLYCKKCKTSNFFYDDNKPPYKCDNCGAALKDGSSTVKKK